MRYSDDRVLLHSQRETQISRFKAWVLFLVPLALAAWFAMSVRAGRGWARTASTVLSCLMIAMMALLQ